MTVKPSAKREFITQQSADNYLVSISAPARDGKANSRLVEVLADHFATAKSHVRILRGHASRNKLIEID